MQLTLLVENSYNGYDAQNIFFCALFAAIPEVAGKGNRKKR